jgi:hypothetical protein
MFDGIRGEHLVLLAQLRERIRHRGTNAELHRGSARRGFAGGQAPVIKIQVGSQWPGDG